MSEVLTDHPVRVRDSVRFNYAAESGNFDCDFIEPGIISYKDQGGGIELLRKETIDRCIGTVIGVPLIVGHEWITEENRAQLENGHVREWYFDPEDGRYHLRGVVESDAAKAQMTVKKPSIGYGVSSYGPGGVYHGIRYDKEITGLIFNHLAIVTRPRYEESTFRLNSIVSNPTNMNVFKLLKKLVTRENGADGKPTETVKTESLQLAGNTEVEIELDGKPVTVHLNDLADVWMKQTAAAVAAKVNGDDDIEIDGKTVKFNELVSCYKTHGMKRENAAPVVAAAPAETPEQKTAREEAEKNQRTNAFFTLHAANATPPKTDGGYSTNSGSLRDKIARGKERY